MRGELSATAGQVELLVTVEPQQDKWRVRLDARELIVDAVRIKPGTWSLILDGRSFLVDVDESKQPNLFHTHRACTPILLESAQRKRLAKAMGQGRGVKSRGEVIKAPIAGRVVKLQVELGELVKPGACVAILEAMKMENEIKTSTGGLVASIDVAPGDSVDNGSKLLSLKPAPEGA